LVLRVGTKWGQHCECVALVSLVLSTTKERIQAIMASLEKRARGGYRIVFRFAGQKFSRSLHTKNPRAANATLARLEDNLHRAELGTFPIPDGVDVATVLLSDGAKSEKTGTSN